MRLLQKALTFDDVLLVPDYSQVLPRDTLLSTKLTRDIDLNLPVVSAAMDTVTEARLAIAIAEEGGIGIIHKNLTAELQAQEVFKVKRFEAGVVKDPITVSPDMSVRQLLALSAEKKISGLPVVKGGRHCYQSRSPFRDPAGSAGLGHHDSERSAGHRERGCQHRRGQGPDASVPHRTGFSC
jgi:IMP dehydrogenase